MLKVCSVKNFTFMAFQNTFIFKSVFFLLYVDCFQNIQIDVECHKDLFEISLDVIITVNINGCMNECDICDCPYKQMVSFTGGLNINHYPTFEVFKSYS